ncbi:hypothetical protein QBC33DRAFT_502067 [Phialemonium atrogriseum]|uniref:Uncharacterized protein n=1 Tax=Phialemonium atrogriseum TaxID=1093897 RepID=A0AAJ0BPK4_9PEZI|nr:uncharacterized protein QBC33DRAFT_502067 [Phialemonium atrogriseum]KAK1761971.1 hypothetical protein QBC33DRAFT_502067 [Phialemonium atrogriseum]
MCGHDTSTTPRIGARVDLFSRATSGPLGNLIFLDPSEPDSTVATHVRFTPEDDGLDADSQILVSIQSEANMGGNSSTGDLTKSVCDSGLFRQFRLPARWLRADTLEVALDRPVSLMVGGDGIIGRRVSMLGERGLAEETLLADGIVGFNSI